MIAELKGTIGYVVKWIQYWHLNTTPIERVFSRFSPRLPSLSGDLLTYQIRQGGDVYTIQMPRSRTFDSYMEFSEGEGGDHDRISYELTPISDLQHAIVTMTTASEVDTELPSEWQRYILDFLDLLSSTREISYRSDVIESSIKVRIPMLGSLIHGMMKIEIIDNLGITVGIDIHFNYGRLHTQGVTINTDPRFNQPLKLTYNNGVLEYPLMSWDDIIKCSRVKYSQKYMLEILYKRLKTDGVIDGRTYPPELQDRQDYWRHKIEGYRRGDGLYYIVSPDKEGTVSRQITVDFTNKTYCSDNETFSRFLMTIKGYSKCIQI